MLMIKNGVASAQQPQQILPVAIFGQGCGKFLDLCGINPLLAKGNFLRAGHLQALALLQGGDKVGGFGQAVTTQR